MIRSVTVIAVSALLTSGAAAADIPTRMAAPAPAPVFAPVFTWTGFYVGANIGAAFGGDRNHLRAVALDPIDEMHAAHLNEVLAGVRTDDDNTRLTGGLQLGYNWQFAALVLGLEADINFRGRGDRGDFTIGFDHLHQDVAHPHGLSYNEGRAGSWFGTIRPRVGFAMDRTLLYVTGGLAYGPSRRGSAVLWHDANENVALDAGEDVMATWGGRSGSNWGWTLGAGVEHAFSNNWTLKFEYLYVDLDRGGSLANLGCCAADHRSIVLEGGREDRFHVLRAGLNWKFGGATSVPVVAAY